MSALTRSYSQAFLGAAPVGYDVGEFLGRAGAIRRAIVEQPSLRAFFAIPAVPADAKAKVVEALARKTDLDEFGRRFLEVLIKNRRLLDLGAILTAIREEADRVSGVVPARVTVAAPIGEAEGKKISDALARTAGRPVRLTTEVDEKILGGFVARIGSSVFDASILRELEQFREQASEGIKA